MDTDCKIDDFVNVSLRIRPALSQDSTESSCLQVISTKPPVLFVLDRGQTYNFDNIFKEEADQETVYDETVKPLVDYVKQGYSCTVFAYGQTGTGKTYTMGTSSQITNSGDAGLIPRALEQFFTYCEEDSETDISISFIEIYNEKVFDLLQNNKPPLTLKGFRIEGLSQEKIFNNREAKHFLKMGNKNRHSSETKQNPNSSRSHAIFTIYCSVKHKNYETTGKLNLVDLAGCESVKKTGNQGSTFQEGVNINKGLLCIGQVMTALSTNSSFIPYRQSVITTILQDSLNRKNRVSLIACVNGNPEDCNETLQTLEFAQRVKRMKNKPEVNEVVMQYKRDNPTLFQPLRTSNTPFKRPASQFQTPCLAKQRKILPLRTINEPSGNSTTTDSPKSLSSISLSSITSGADVVCQTVSPVVKKYMAAMESSLADRIETIIMGRMETLIQNTLKRPTRSSLLAREREENNKENTPSMSWSRIQNEVSKLVRTEIGQLTMKATRATSSPIDEQDGLDKIRKVLKYESPVLERPNEGVGKPEGEPVFKVPELPVLRKKVTESNRTLSVSPIEFASEASLDSSYGYSGSNTTSASEISIDKLEFGPPRCSERRSSARLAGKQQNKQASLDSSCDYSRRNASSGSEISIDKLEFGPPRYSERRSSVRLAEKEQNKNKEDLLDQSPRRNKRIRNKRKECYKETPLHKVPKQLIPKKKSVTKKDHSISPIGFEPKRGTLQSLKRQIDNQEVNSTSDEASFNESHSDKRRCSVRLSRKQNKEAHNNNSLDDFDLEASLQIINKSCVVTKGKDNAPNIKASKTKAPSKLDIKATPAGKRLLKNETNEDSPATAHTKSVLTSLNSGSAKQLEKLHTIGAKTAQQILLFRKIKGPLNKISDLSEMPGWQGKKFKRFVERNFVKWRAN